MRADIINLILSHKEPIEICLAKLQDTIGSLQRPDDINFGLHTKIPETDESFADTITRLHLVISSISILEKVKQPELLPIKQLNNILLLCQNLKTFIQNIHEAISNLNREGVSLTSFDSELLIFTSSDENETSILENSQKFHQSIEELIWLICILTPTMRAKGSIDFTSTSEALLKVYSNIQTAYKDLRNGFDAVENSTEQIKIDLENIKHESEELKRLKSESFNERKTISEYLAEITQNRSTVKEIYEDAVTLKSAVSEYTSEFDLFQKSLDQRNRAFEIGKSRLKELVEKFEERESQIAEIQKQAENMLSSSTVAGLASHFLKIRDELTEELGSTQATFKKGIIFLSLSAIPLLLFVLHPILSPIYAALSSTDSEIIMNSLNSASRDKWGYLGQTIGRMTLLLPAIWFVSFNTIRYSSLFRLREHYAYKYSMAAAVEGFKHQAPEYQEEIAALVLEQLAFNPADKLIPSKEIKEGKVPNIGRYLYDKITEKTKKEAD